MADNTSKNTDNTDNQDYSRLSADKERDMAAKGGPIAGPGIADNKHGIAHPYSSDTQTQLAAASTANKNNQNKNQQANNITPNDENILGENDDDVISKD